ncbi:hypothetical protein V7968_32125 [Nocardia vulneris]|uniref:hypothetical protein n=1 Tax=Nocardia vulneris TaxID=1141657 RepID=UPI0030CF318A
MDRPQDEHDQRTLRREPDHGGNPSDQFTRITDQDKGFRRRPLISASGDMLASSRGLGG